MVHRPGFNTANKLIHKVVVLQTKTVEAYGVGPDTLYLGQYEKRMLEVLATRFTHVMEKSTKETVLLGMRVVYVEAETYLSTGVPLDG